MKKRRLFLAAAALSVFLVGGCQSRGEEEKPIEACTLKKAMIFRFLWIPPQMYFLMPTSGRN